MPSFRRQIVLSLVASAVLATAVWPLHAAENGGIGYYDNLLDPKADKATQRKDIISIGKEANQFGKEIGKQAIEQLEAGQLQDLGTDFSFNGKDKNAERWIQFSVDQNAIDGLKDDPSKLEQQGQAKGKTMAKEMQTRSGETDQSKTSVESMVYQIVRQKRGAEEVGQAEMVTPDKDGKLPLDASAKIFDNPSGAFGELADCTTKTITGKVTSLVRIPDLQTCNQYADLTKDCTLTHEYAATRTADKFQDYGFWGLDTVERDFEATCTVPLTVGTHTQSVVMCKRGPYEKRTKVCEEKLILEPIPTCQLGSVQEAYDSGSAWDKENLHGDNVPGADTLRVSYTCVDAEKPVIRVSTNSGNNSGLDITIYSDEAYWDRRIELNGGMARMIGSRSCTEGKCTVEASMAVYRGKGTAGAYSGQISAKLDFVPKSQRDFKEYWSQSCQ